MQRKSLLFLTGINCIFVPGLIAWVIHLQTARPSTTMPRQNIEREAVPVETLLIAVRLESLTPSTPEQFQALTQSVARIRQRGEIAED